MNRLTSFLLMALLLFGMSCNPAGHSGKEYSAMKCDVSALPDAQAFIADIVISRMEERIPPSGGAATFKVKFLIDPSLDGERAEINVRRGKAEIRGARFRSLVAGTGEMLRAISYGEQTFRLPDTVLIFAPAKPFREVYFGRHFDNWYHRAPAERMLRYIDDMALWGMNAVHTILNYPAVDAAHATDADKAAFAAVSKAMASRVRDLDMDLTVSGGGNVAPADMPAKFRATLNTDWRRGGNEWCVCPEIPGAMDYLLNVKKDHISQLTGHPISGIEFWPYDEGGCGCPLCSPWGGKGYVKLIERYRHLFDEAFPGCNEEDFVAFIHTLEDTHETYVEGSENDYFVKSYIVNGPAGELARRGKICADNLALAKKIEADMIPSMRDSWRWRVLKLRAVIDDQLYSTRQLHNAILDDAYRELVGIYCAEEQMKGVARGYGGHTCPPILDEYRNEENN